MSIGPQMPPGLVMGVADEGEDDLVYDEEIPTDLVEVLPANDDNDDVNDDTPDIFGPALPPNMSANNEHSDDGVPSEEEDSFGPAMPPDMEPSTSDKEDEDQASNQSNGPSIPGSSEKPTTKKPADSSEASGGKPDMKCYGPTMPPGFEMNGGSDDDEDNEDDDEFGPSLPVNMDDKEAEEQYLCRLIQMKKAQEEAEAGKNKREEWMTALPEKLRTYGLGARTFSKSGTQEADASWTDAPGTSKEKPDKSKTAGSAARSARDVKLEKAAVELNSTRTESLMTMHGKRKAEEEADDTKPKERRPFNRDIDLGIVKCLDGKKHADKLQEKAGLLASRFGHGSGQKYL